MMKAKETNGACSISLLALPFFLIIYKALAYELSLPSYENQEGQQRCGFSCETKCPPGLCCSWLGYCGTTVEYCGRQHCQEQCPSPPPPPHAPPPPYAPGQCGMQAGGRKCPPGLCCSLSGWCGATEEYCREGECQSQCHSNLTSHKTQEGQRECGYQGCYKKCPPGSCCSLWGWCGTTKEFCGKYVCQDQCPSPPPAPPPPPYAPGRCGMQEDGRKYPPGLCCSSSGWCGTTKLYCAKEWCQSQWKSTTLTSSIMNRVTGIGSFFLNGYGV
ncbi:hypothetical protein P3S68_006291 [Capsicum galapagoense]